MWDLANVSILYIKLNDRFDVDMNSSSYPVLFTQPIC